MNNISYKKVAEKIIDELKLFYQNYEIQNNDKNKEIVFQKNKVTISIYHSKSVLYQGFNCQKEANRFFALPNNLLKEDTLNLKSNYFESDIIGNDEVGVGDVFGPLVVTSVFLPNESILKLKKLNIKDSKKLTKNEIITLAPQIKTLVLAKTNVMNNQQYNQLYDQYQNSHVLKALGHNQALLNLISHHQLEGKKIIIDQFASPKKYFEYLKDEANVVKNSIYFITKGEEKSLAIACSSIIARYTFLLAIKELEKKYGLPFPLGANENVKEIARKYKQKYGETICQNFMKLHFNLVAK